jgi:hypothetical protein
MASNVHQSKDETKMAGKRTEIKPTKRAQKNLKSYARRASEMREKFIAQGRRFSDSSEIVRADRDSRI